MANEAKDSLRSKATLNLLDLLGEGKIGGLVDGEKSIFLDNTPLMNGDGTYNFNGVTTEFTNGTNDQAPLYSTQNFVETPYALNVKVLKDTPITFTVSGQDTDTVRVIVYVQGLSYTNSGNGDISGTDVSYKIQMSVNNGAFLDITDTLTISGKTRSKYQRNHMVRVPQNQICKFKLVRITDDSTSAYLQNDLYLDSYSEIISLNMSYPNSVLCGISIDSEQLSKIPTRSYLVDGLYIHVPTNYDPVSRQYSGIWDGTFKVAISNNPAWVLYDILSKNRYGLGNYIGSQNIDKAALYTIGKYCDEQVPNGFGGFEPRFTINTVIANRQDAYKVITDITSAFRGMSFWDGSSVSTMQDSPQDPVFLYTKANTINGEFSYTGSARKDRYSSVCVTWNDPDDYYRQKVEYVEDRDLIEKYGVRKLDTIAFGCTSRGQAVRDGKWILYTQKYESELCQYGAGLDSAFITPGNIVQVQNPDKAGKRMGGRLLGCTLNKAILDSDAITPAMQNPVISIMLEDGRFVDRQVNRVLVYKDDPYVDADYVDEDYVEEGSTAVTWMTPLPSLPVPNGVWTLSDVGTLEPVLMRIVGKSQGENNGEFAIAALEHNPSKYGYIEEGLDLTIRNTSIINSSFVESPLNITVTESTYSVAPGLLGVKLSIDWQSDCNTFELRYRCVADDNKTNWTVRRITGSLSFEIENALTGLYQFELTAINPLGKRSATSFLTYTVVGTLPSGNEITNLAYSYVYPSITLAWRSSAISSLEFYEIRLGSEFESAEVLGTSRVESFRYNPATLGNLNFWVAKKGQDGNYASIKSLIVPIAQMPQLDNVVAKAKVGAIVVKYDTPLLADFGGVRVFISETSGFTPSDSTLAYDGPDSTITIYDNAQNQALKENTTYYLKVAAYSKLGKTGLNYSPELSVLVVSALTPSVDISGFTGFRQSASGLFTPTNALLKSVILNVFSPTYLWTITGATPVGSTDANVTISPNSTATTISVTLTVGGANLPTPITKTISMPVVYDGVTGQAGSNGVATASPSIFQWTSSSTPPTRPSSSSTYTWATGVYNAPAGWNTSSPSNTTPGAYLWSITIPVVQQSGETDDTINWGDTSYPIRAVAYNGINGAQGPQGNQGPQGSQGVNGASGSNGSATYVVTRVANDSSAPSNAETVAIIGRAPVAGDICTVSYNNYNNSAAYRYTTGWVLFNSYITGSLIVQNTITGDKIVGNTITADKIDSRGLSIKDASGTIILASGTALPSNYVSGLGSLATQNGVDYGSQVSGKPSLGSLASQNAVDYNSGQLANKPTLGNFAALNQITESNISTYIANLAVQTLQIGNNQVTIPMGFSSGLVQYINDQSVTLITGSIQSSGAPKIIQFRCKVNFKNLLQNITFANSIYAFALYRIDPDGGSSVLKTFRAEGDSTATTLYLDGAVAPGNYTYYITGLCFADNPARLYPAYSEDHVMTILEVKK